MKLLSNKHFNMEFPLNWSWFAALLLCPLFMGGDVRCDCTEQGMEMEGGSYALTKNLSYGSVLVYECPEGYYPHPAAVRMCELSGNWNPPTKRTPQTCRVVECPDPNVLENGDVFPPQVRYFVNNTTTYECYSGYKLRGSPSRVCTANGKWSGGIPICSRDSGETCADPGIPPGARRTGHLFGIGDRMTYHCGHKLFLVGSKVRVCQENGEWTGNEPACYYKYTYDTAEEVAQAFGSSIKQSLRSLEALDDTQEGRIIRITKNGTLNIYIAVDFSESIEKEALENAIKAVKILISKIASFTATPNYEIFFFSSEIFEIVKIEDFFDSKQSPRAAMISQLDAFSIAVRGEEVGTDLSLAFNHILKKMAYIKRVGQNFAEHQHVLIFFTDGIYNMGGSPAPTVARIKQMVYGPKTDDEQAWKKREENLDIYIFGIGAEVYADDLQPLTAGTGGNHYFRLKNLEDLMETFDKIIDEEAVKGLCGLHREYNPDNSVLSKQRMFPWLVSIIIKNRNCLGSLVTPMYVLTAAHCFRFGDEPSDVQVDIDDGVNRVHQVESFKLHEKYNVTAKKKSGGVEEFYDYDVALVLLKDYVEISNRARPICIPCTKETGEALRLGNSTCSQQEELLLKNQLESLTFLTKSSTIEEKHVHAKRGDNRDECISHALKANGITTTNPKDAVTDNFLCTGGRTPSVDQIACTGDSGGALFKNYEHRTVQIGVVSWGTKLMCRGGGVMRSNDDSRDFHINLFKVVPFLKAVLGKRDETGIPPLEFVAN